MSANEPTKPTITPKTPVAATPSKVTAKAVTKVIAKKAPAKPEAAKVVQKTAAAKPTAKPATKAVPQAAVKATAKPAKAAAKPAALPKAKPVKVKKPKMVRDSFTMPKAEFAVIDALKNRAANLKKPAKKTELIRAGIKALAAMSDAAFANAIAAVPSLKTGRPAKS